MQYCKQGLRILMVLVAHARNEGVGLSLLTLHCYDNS